MSLRSAFSARAAIVGAASLRGKELRQVLEERSFPASDVVLFDETLPIGTLTEAGGEPAFIHPMGPESFEGVRFAFFAGAPEETARNWRLARRVGAAVIDLTGALGESAAAIPWMPSLARILAPPGPPREAASAANTVFSSPAPPVIVACALVAALAPLSPARVALLFLLPVSERGQAGVNELESQTASLLSFRSITQPVFDSQVAFNLLSAYGEASRPRLEEIRLSMARAVAQYLAGRAALPAIQLIQAPVFYGCTFAGYLEFAVPVALEAVERALASAGMKFPGEGEAAPNNVSVMGASEIALAHVVWDSSVKTGMWLWGAVDNLRLAATNAVQIAEELLAK